MKKISIFLALVMLFSTTFSSCQKKPDEKYTEIHSLADFYAMQADKSYILMCDIDLQNELWKPLTVYKFDGNGHTISNGVISEYYHPNAGATDPDRRRQALFVAAAEIKNLTIERITVVAQNVPNVAVLVADCNQYDCNIENLTIKDCKINAIYTYEQELDNIFVCFGTVVAEANRKTNITNCLVANCSITASFDGDALGLYVGGIVGRTDYATTVKKCSFQGGDIDVTSARGSAHGNNIGGIAGGDYSTGTNEAFAHNFIECIVKESVLSGKNQSSAQLRIGGIVGCAPCETTTIANCASHSNEIAAAAKYGYNLGGIVGKCGTAISNCYSAANTILGTSVQKDDLGRYIGGIAGSTTQTISKCISQRNTLTGETDNRNNEDYTAGIVAKASASIVNCYSNGNTVTGFQKDAFAPEGNVFESLLTHASEPFLNANQVSLIDTSDWQAIYNALALSNEYWSCNSLTGITLKILQ